MDYPCDFFPVKTRKQILSKTLKGIVMKSSKDNLDLDILVGLETEVTVKRRFPDSARENMKKPARQFLQSVHYNSKDFPYLFTWKPCTVMEDVPIFFQVQLLFPQLNSKVNIHYILTTNIVISVHFLACFYSSLSHCFRVRSMIPSSRTISSMSSNTCGFSIVGVICQSRN